MNPYIGKILTFVSILVIAGGAVFRVTGIADQNKEIDRLQTVYLDIRNKKDAGDNIQSSLHKAKQDLKVVLEHLPAFNEFPYVLKEINDLLQKNDINSSGLLFKPVKTEKLSLWQYSSAFSVEGRYADLKSFLSEFQAIPGIHTVSKLLFRVKPEKPGDVSLDMSISIYCRGDDL